MEKHPNKIKHLVIGVDLHPGRFTHSQFTFCVLWIVSYFAFQTDNMSPEWKDQNGHAVISRCTLLTSVERGTNQESLAPEPISICHDSFIDLFVLVINPGCRVFIAMYHLVLPSFLSSCFERHFSFPAYCVRIHHAVVVTDLAVTHSSNAKLSQRMERILAHTQAHPCESGGRRSEVA